MANWVLSTIGYIGLSTWLVLCRAVYYRSLFGRLAVFLTDAEREQLGRSTTRSRRSGGAAAKGAAEEAQRQRAER